MEIPADKLVRLSGDQIAKIDAGSLSALKGNYWDKVPVYQVVNFGDEAVQSVGVLEKLSASQIAYFTPRQWDAVPVESIATFTTEKVHAINPIALDKWTKETWEQVPEDTIAALVDQQIQTVPPEVAGQYA